jgi:hypothetical protein
LARLFGALSWLNLVEVWFSFIERRAVHRGSFRSVAALNAAVRTVIHGWNDRCHPFVRTGTADQILAEGRSCIDFGQATGELSFPEHSCAVAQLTAGRIPPGGIRNCPVARPGVSGIVPASAMDADWCGMTFAICFIRCHRLH